MTRYTGTRVTITTTDGFPLAASRFEPPTGTLPRAAAVIGCATGVYAQFYNGFAAWLATQGVSAWTFDYRYAGLSFPPPYKPSTFIEEERNNAMRTCPPEVNSSEFWAKKDFAAAVRHASDANPGLPLTVIGSSIGGHLMTLFPDEWPRITRFLSVCGGNSYYGNIPEPDHARYIIQVVIRAELEKTRLFPAPMLGLGRILPFGPGMEWVKWSDHPHFALDTKEVADRIRMLDKPLLYVGFEDDSTLNKNMMVAQMGLYSHADRQKHTLWIDPAKHNPRWPPCKHVNSLMKSPPSKSTSKEPPTLTLEETIWQVYLAYILTGHIDTTAGEYKCWAPEDERDLVAERAAHEERIKHEKPLSETFKANL